jgi:hypothetical protein
MQDNNITTAIHTDGNQLTDCFGSMLAIALSHTNNAVTIEVENHICVGGIILVCQGGDLIAMSKIQTSITIMHKTYITLINCKGTTTVLMGTTAHIPLLWQHLADTVFRVTRHQHTAPGLCRTAFKPIHYITIDGCLTQTQ